jgi:hypothetical protein
MPFDGIDPEAENSVRILEMIEARLEGGRMWVRGCMFAAAGRVCLLGAHQSVARRCEDHGKADRALHYLARAIGSTTRSRSSPRWISSLIVEFNDTCAGYEDVERVLHKAQELALADAAPTTVMDFDHFAGNKCAQFNSHDSSA